MTEHPTRIEIYDVQKFCTMREVDLVLAPCTHPYQVRLRGEYNGYGEFFLIDAADVEYIEFSPLTVSEIKILQDVGPVLRKIERWRDLASWCSGSALMISGTANEVPRTTRIVIANTITLTRGSDWP